MNLTHYGRRKLKMRGKRAKKLRQMALHYVLTVLKKSAGEGYNKYNHAMNCMGWTRQLDADGFPMQDPDGGFLRTLEKKPGTLTCAWHTRVMYLSLKKRWKCKHSTTT
jgi:hypothetical protein